MSLDDSTHDPRFPIGKFVMPSPDTPITKGERDQAIVDLAELPEQLRNAVEPMSHEQLDTPYREGGWTVRQLVHHIADSDMNAFVRLRLALTDDWPKINPFDENKWAELHDTRAAPVEWSLELIESLHARWVMVLQSLTEEQWKRGFVHAERGPMTNEVATMLYGWHSRHHTAHITHLRLAQGW